MDIIHQQQVQFQQQQTQQQHQFLHEQLRLNTDYDNTQPLDRNKFDKQYAETVAAMEQFDIGFDEMMREHREHAKKVELIRAQQSELKEASSTFFSELDNINSIDDVKKYFG